MKMRLLPLFVVLAALALNTTLPAQAARTVPDLGQVKEIILHGQEGLILKIFQNGSADLVYGTHDAKIPSQTFSFQNIYENLTPDLVGIEAQYKTVGLASPGAAYGSVYYYYAKEQKLVDRLLSEAGVRVVREG